LKGDLYTGREGGLLGHWDHVFLKGREWEWKEGEKRTLGDTGTRYMTSLEGVVLGGNRKAGRGIKTKSEYRVHLGVPYFGGKGSLAQKQNLRPPLSCS